MRHSRALVLVAALAVAGCKAPQALSVVDAHPSAPGYTIADNDFNDSPWFNAWRDWLKRHHHGTVAPSPGPSPTPTPVANVQTLTIDYPTTGAAWDTAVLTVADMYSGSTQTKTLANGVDLLSTASGVFTATGSILSGLTPGNATWSVDLWSGGAGGTLVGEGQVAGHLNNGQNSLTIPAQAYPSLGVLSFTPDTAASGSTITVAGQGFSIFSALDTVTVGGEQVNVTSASSVSLTVTLPTDLNPGKYNVWVQVGANMAGKAGFTLQ